MPKRDEIRLTHRLYPNGAPHYAVYLGVILVGLIDIKDDGFVPFGCRKPIATLEGAARTVIWRRVQASLKQAAESSEAMDYPITVEPPT